MTRRWRLHRMPLRRSVTGAALTAAIALALTACGLGGGAAPAADAVGAPVPELSPNQQVDITFESYNLAQAGTWTNTVNGLIAQFEAAHPNIHVHAQAPQGTALSSGNYIASVQNEIVAGNAPDVDQVTFGDLDFAVNQLKAKSLDALVGKDAVQANFAGEFPYATSARTLGDWNGQTYGMPYVFSTPVLFYNASLFQQAGLDPNKPPTTWAEVKQDALAIKAKTGRNGAYVDCLTQVSGDWCYQSLVDSNGGSVISTDRKKLTFADGPAVQAVSMAQDLVSSGASPDLTQSQASAAMNRGELGMMLETSALQGSFLQSAKAGGWDLRAAAEPAFPGHAAVPTNSGSALMVFSNDPAKQRASWELIQFLTSPTAYDAISSRIGYLPLRTGLVDSPQHLKSWADANPLIRPNLAQLDRLQPWVSFPGNSYTQIRQYMMTAVEDSVYRGKDPQSTLAAAQSRAQALMPTG